MQNQSRTAPRWRYALAALIWIGGLGLSGCGAGSATPIPAAAPARPGPGEAATAYVTALDRSDTDAANLLLASTVKPWPASTKAEELGQRCRPTGTAKVKQTGTAATVELSCASGGIRLLTLTEEADGWKVIPIGIR